MISGVQVVYNDTMVVPGSFDALPLYSGKIESIDCTVHTLQYTVYVMKLIK